MDKFSLSQYVPILRWKQAERGALAQLVEDDTKNITPLIEIVPENFEQGKRFLENEEAMHIVASQVMQSWGERPVYIDFPNDTPLPIIFPGDCLTLLARYCGLPSLSIIPVTGLHRDLTYNSAVRNVMNIMGQGACFRITIDELQHNSIEPSLNHLLDILSVDYTNVDVLVDCQIINKATPNFEDIKKLVPESDKWRNIIVACGAFPEDLTHFRKNLRHSIPRADWTNWRKQVEESPKVRIPTYSDYTIQFPKYIPRRRGFMQYSASIRYTIEDEWVILRGESVFKKGGLGFNQYPDLAIMLCDLPQYCGESFSNGDRYIKSMSLQHRETGAAPQWLQAGINHHLVFTSRQLLKYN